MSRTLLAVSDVVRRVAVTVSAGGLWGWEGYVAGDEVEDGTAPAFGGIGIYARPGDGDRAEAILVHVGAAADNPALAALRNEDARRRYVETFGDLEKGELAVFPSSGKTRILMRQDGTIVLEVDPGQKVLAQSVGGVPAELATKADVQECVDKYNGHGHPDPSSGTTGPPVDAGAGVATRLMDDPDGTTVLQGE